MYGSIRARKALVKSLGMATVLSRILPAYGPLIEGLDMQEDVLEAVTVHLDFIFLQRVEHECIIGIGGYAPVLEVVV